jgi:hypothetical protein
MEKPADERIGRGALTPLAGVEDHALPGPQAKHEQAFHERFEHQTLYRVLDYQMLAEFRSWAAWPASRCGIVASVMPSPPGVGPWFNAARVLSALDATTVPIRKLAGAA